MVEKFVPVMVMGSSTVVDPGIGEVTVLICGAGMVTVTVTLLEHTGLLTWAAHTRHNCVSAVPVFTSIVIEVELMFHGDCCAQAH